MRRKRWSEAEIAMLIEHYPNTRTRDLATRLGRTLSQVFNKANALGLRKTKETVVRMARDAMAHADHPGRKTQFKPGQKSWNTGLHYQPGGRSAETRFKPGRRLGAAALNYQPVGAERISKDGYLERKINDDLPYYKRWRMVHLLVWEAVNGSVPEGQALTFLDGNKRNVAIENLTLISRAELMRRNTIHNYGPEVAQLVQLRGAISRQLNRRDIECPI